MRERDLFILERQPEDQLVPLERKNMEQVAQGQRQQHWSVHSSECDEPSRPWPPSSEPGQACGLIHREAHHA